MMRAIIRKSAEGKTDLHAYVGHLEDRLDAIARTQAAADERGSVNLENLFAEEFNHYRTSEGPRLALSGPSIELQPKAALVLALAAHELAVNAVEHGALGIAAGKILVSWSLLGDAIPQMTLTWDEFTGVSPVHHRSLGNGSGFGTDVLVNMLRYELQARTLMQFEPGHVRCTILMPMPQSVGRSA